MVRMREEQLMKYPPVRDVLRKAILAPLVAILATILRKGAATMELQPRKKPVCSVKSIESMIAE